MERIDRIINGLEEMVWHEPTEGGPYKFLVVFTSKDEDKTHVITYYFNDLKDIKKVFSAIYPYKSGVITVIDFEGRKEKTIDWGN